MYGTEAAASGGTEGKLCSRTYKSYLKTDD